MKSEMSTSVLDAMDKASPKERRGYLEGRLKELIGYAYKMAPAVRARFDEAGVAPSAVSTMGDLEKLPILRKDDLITLQKADPPFGGLVTVPIQKLIRVYVSPGPIYDPHHQSETYWRRHVHIIRTLGFCKGDIVVVTPSYHLTPGGLLWDEALRLIGATVIPAGVGNTELQVRIMHDLKVTGFCGFTGFLANIINKAEEMGYDIGKDFHLRLAFAGGEMGGGPIRIMAEQKYGIATRDAYGIAETGLIAYECGERSGLHITGDVIVEIIDPESGKQVDPGEVGEIVMTAIDVTYPLIRFGTGDLAAMNYESCCCGRTSPRIVRILGRVGDAVRARGMFIHPRQLEPAFSQFKGISKYQAVVTRPGYRDELKLKVELKTAEGVDKERFSKQLSKAVNEAVRIKVDRVAFVAKGVIPEEHKLIVDERVY